MSMGDTRSTFNNDWYLARGGGTLASPGTPVMRIGFNDQQVTFRGTGSADHVINLIKTRPDGMWVGPYTWYGSTINSYLAVGATNNAQPLRWQLQLGNADPESGSWTGTNFFNAGDNSGSNFTLNRYDDMGVLLDTPLRIDRKTGIAKLYAGGPGAISTLQLDTPGEARLDFQYSGSTMWSMVNTAGYLAFTRPGAFMLSMNATDIIAETKVTVKPPADNAQLILDALWGVAALRYHWNGTYQAQIENASGGLNFYIGSGVMMTIKNDGMVVDRDPTQPLQVATKQYVDAIGLKQGTPISVANGAAIPQGYWLYPGPGENFGINFGGGYTANINRSTMFYSDGTPVSMQGMATDLIPITIG
jgi:hypothetical protein